MRTNLRSAKVDASALNFINWRTGTYDGSVHWSLR